jgi:hypothetical protein
MAIDRGLAALRSTRPGIHLDADPASSIAVVGFPRSANTLLAHWLTMVARPGVSVIGGRLSHSVLDLRRIVDSGIPVVIPVREPVDACASMMTRKGLSDSPGYARRLLRAYVAWHRAAGQVLGTAGVTVAPFGLVTTEPWLLADRPLLRELVDVAAPGHRDMTHVVERTREAIADVVGQGLPEDGVPAHLMVSLPEPAREPSLERARAILRDPVLGSTRMVAERSYEEFMSAAELAQAAHFAGLGPDVRTRQGSDARLDLTRQSYGQIAGPGGTWPAQRA